MKIVPARPALSLAALSLLAVATPAAQNEDIAPHYGRVAVDEAPIRNLADERGMEIASVARGALLEVHRELAGWLEVEVPGGFSVWVHGRYLQPVSGEEGVYEVTRNAVNLRPRPKSDVTNFPLPQRLHAGDRVRGIALQEPSQPLDANWVNVWSPPGVCAWIQASAVKDLAAGEDGKALWDAAIAELATSAPQKTPVAKAPVPASAPVAPAKPAKADAPAPDEAQARADLERGRELLSAAVASSADDLAPARSALEAAADKATPDGEVAGDVAQELERLAFYEEAARLRSELAQARQQLTDEVQKRREEALDEARQHDPLAGVYTSRGLLTRQVSVDGTPRYFLSYGGTVRSELLCPGGRYSLDDFAGYDVGVFASPAQTSEDRKTDVPLLLVDRLEVVARR